MRNPWTALRKLWHEAKYEEVSTSEVVGQVLATWHAHDYDSFRAAHLQPPFHGTLTLTGTDNTGETTTVQGEVHIP